MFQMAVICIPLIIIFIVLSIAIQKTHANSSTIFHPSHKIRIISSKNKHYPQVLRRYLGFSWWGFFYYPYQDPDDDDECATVEYKEKFYSKISDARQHCIDAMNKSVKPKNNVFEITNIAYSPKNSGEHL